MAGQTEELYVASDFANKLFTSAIEGAATDAQGNIYAVSFGEDRETIGIVSPEGKGRLHVKLEPGQSANGIRFSSKEEMFIADCTGHNVLKYNSDTGKTSVFAHNSNMNQPNDICIMDNDILFASDPNWAEGSGKLWRITPDGQTTLLEDNMGTTNGIEVSPDNKKLYVNESKQLNLWVYDLGMGFGLSLLTRGRLFSVGRFGE